LTNVFFVYVCAECKQRPDRRAYIKMFGLLQNVSMSLNLKLYMFHVRL